ncbi:MAG: peptide chain release factor N(5)-glutamine methyltransferase [Pseudomonadales bacterium]
MTTVAEWLAQQADLPRLDRELLVCRAAALSRAQVLGRPERALPAGAEAELDRWAARRRAGEPLAYIVGEREFYGRTFTVSPSVLVPRPETELLVEAALAVARPGRWLDLGTGSGAVAVTLALEAHVRGRTVAVTATDISAAALAVAAANAARLGAEVRWLGGDWFEALAEDDIGGDFQLIVSNPPYVAAADPHLAALGHEPQAALASGADGLDALRVIVRGAPDRLAPGGWLLLEHGYDQGGPVRDLLSGAGLTRVETLADLAGHPRVSRAMRPEASA